MVINGSKWNKGGDTDSVKVGWYSAWCWRQWHRRMTECGWWLSATMRRRPSCLRRADCCYWSPTMRRTKLISASATYPCCYAKMETAAEAPAVATRRQRRQSKTKMEWKRRWASGIYSMRQSVLEGCSSPGPAAAPAVEIQGLTVASVAAAAPER